MRQERGIFGVDAEGCAVKVEEEEHERRLKFQPSLESGRCGSSLESAVCCTLERGCFMIMSKDVEWKLRQERGVLYVEAEGCAVEVEEEEHER